MPNGSNDIGVRYSQIAYFCEFLDGHPAVDGYTRRDDIVFDVQLKNMNAITILICNEYTCSLARVIEFVARFGPLHIITVGGNWNSYTTDAKEFCLEAELGLYSGRELYRALFRREYWSFHFTDKDGNPVYGE
ncbi:hypothetical protein HNQ68_003143 [Pseudochrobactrum saccharolyticum]|uniref:Uncharacterized protein n=1 Tax=Pseudochrobactrum saccharolyticum TaxID=354352 RepID=A0A7W8ALL2_9HYPH|nr:hypothetical protein F7P81_16530 [Pseudochrobactrum saccharolyticum]MBB5092586.1 hypothetical protein [Pseudochrobactrum saccharolyticum]